MSFSVYIAYYMLKSIITSHFDNLICNARLCITLNVLPSTIYNSSRKLAITCDIPRSSLSSSSSQFRVSCFSLQLPQTQDSNTFHDGILQCLLPRLQDAFHWPPILRPPTESHQRVECIKTKPLFQLLLFHELGELFELGPTNRGFVA